MRRCMLAFSIIVPLISWADEWNEFVTLYQAHCNVTSIDDAAWDETRIQGNLLYHIWKKQKDHNCQKAFIAAYCSFRGVCFWHNKRKTACSAWAADFYDDWSSRESGRTWQKIARAQSKLSLRG